MEGTMEWNMEGTREWKMEWNSKCTQLQVTLHYVGWTT